MLVYFPNSVFAKAGGNQPFRLCPGSAGSRIRFCPLWARPVDPKAKAGEEVFFAIPTQGGTQDLPAVGSGPHWPLCGAKGPPTYRFGQVSRS